MEGRKTPDYFLMHPIANTSTVRLWRATYNGVHTSHRFSAPPYSVFETMAIQYPLSSPVLLQNIPRSAEERSTLCNMHIELAPLVSQGILGVIFEQGGRCVRSI